MTIVATNLVTNPSFLGTSLDWVPNAFASSAIVNGALEITGQVAGDCSIRTADTKRYAATPGQAYSFRVRVRNTTGHVASHRLIVRFYDQPPTSATLGNQLQSTNTYQTLGIGEAADIVTDPATPAAPAGAQSMSLFIVFTAVAVGEVTTVDQLLCVAAATPPAYFDGSTPDSNPDYYAWTGTPHASTSTHTVSAGSRVDKTTVSIAGLGGGPTTPTLAASNLAPNPSFETNTGYWGLSNGTATTPLAAAEGIPALAGARVLKMVCPGVNGQAYTGAPTTGGNRYTGAPWVYCLTPMRFTVFATQGSPSGGGPSIPGQTDTDVPAGVWTRLIPLSGVTPAAETSTNFIVRALTAGTFYLDGMMVASGATLPDYFDGDTADTIADTYAWTGTPHGSTSTHTTIPVTDATCYVDRVTMRHGRDDYGEQPEADSITLEMSVDHHGNAVPSIEVGADITVTYQATDVGPVFTRFRGRVSDVNRSWEDAGEDTPDRGTCQVVAVSSLGELGRRLVGDQPWPQELDGARVLRVLQLAYPTLPAVNVDPGIYQVVARDVDRKDALSLIQDTADAGGGILWTAAGDPFPHYADFEHRRGTVAALEIDACDILASPTWTRDLSGLCNYVSLTYGLDPVNPPDGAPTEAPSLTSRNQASVDKYGEYGLSVRLELANQADAQARASLLTTRNGTPAWVLSDLPLDMGGLSTADVETILGLDMHALILLTGLPTAGSAPTSAYAWIEGWNEVLAAGVHDLTLAVSGYCATSPPVRWNDVAPEATWDTADPAWTWDSVVCIGPTPNRGRWDDVPATTRWDTVPPATTWDTWPTP